MGFPGPNGPGYQRLAAHSGLSKVEPSGGDGAVGGEADGIQEFDAGDVGFVVVRLAMTDAAEEHSADAISDGHFGDDHVVGCKGDGA